MNEMVKNYFHNESDEHNIENIDLKQSPIGLLLNYGTIKIKGQGFSTFYFENIINPINFKNEINIIMEKNK